MQIETWPVSRCVPYFRNPRKNDQAVDRMAASITEFGFKIPVLARSNGDVVDGHLRLKAAQKLGLTEIPVILCDEWTPAQVKAFRLMVNRSVTWAGWNLESVALEIQELKGLDFDLALTGFDPPEIDDFLLGDQQARGSEDEVPNPGPVVTRPGDLWICAGHRILCGSATSAESVGALLGTAKPTLMVTDPPYGIKLDPSWRERAGLGELRQTGKVPNDDRADWREAYKLFPGDVAYVWHAGIHAGEVAAGLETAGFQIRAQIIWSKQHFALSRGDYHWQHEPCWYAVREGESSEIIYLTQGANLHILISDALLG